MNNKPKLVTRWNLKARIFFNSSLKYSDYENKPKVKQSGKLKLQEKPMSKDMT